MKKAMAFIFSVMNMFVLAKPSVANNSFAGFYVGIAISAVQSSQCFNSVLVDSQKIGDEIYLCMVLCRS